MNRPAVVAVAPAGVPRPRRPPLAAILLAGLGAFVALASVGLLASTTNGAWVLGSFGASCVLLFGFPDGPFSKPRNVIGGHLLSSAVGLLFLEVLGVSWWAMAAAGATAAMLMLLTNTVHPPAGSNPVIVFLGQPGWDFLVLPTLAGACVLTVIGTGYRLALARQAERRRREPPAASAEAFVPGPDGEPERP